MPPPRSRGEDEFSGAAAPRAPRTPLDAEPEDAHWRVPDPFASEGREESAPPLEETLGLSEGFARRAEARRAAGRGDERRHRGVFSGAARAGGGAFWLLGRLFGARGLSGAAGRAYGRARDRGWTAGAAPYLAVLVLCGAIAATPSIQQTAGEVFARVSAVVLARPEYAIYKLDVGGVRNVDLEELRLAVLEGADARAAFAFDYAGARERIEALGWVERASVVLKPPHTLAIDIIEREPAALWRHGAELTLLDPTGVSIAGAKTRAAHPMLPLLVGPGAEEAVAEALRLGRIAADGGLSVAAMTRVGRRRWDFELVGGPRLMLPERDPQSALERAVRWAQSGGLLQRGFAAVDLRLPHAPAARPAPAPEEPRAAALSAATKDDGERRL